MLARKDTPHLADPLTPIEVVESLGAGFFAENLVKCLNEVADEVKKHAPGTATGKVTVTLEVGYVGDELGCTFKDSYKIALPAREGMGSFFFATKDGIFKRDPRRPEFLFRTVDQGPGEIREVALAEQPLRESESRNE